MGFNFMRKKILVKEVVEDEKAFESMFVVLAGFLKLKEDSKEGWGGWRGLFARLYYFYEKNGKR